MANSFLRKTIDWFTKRDLNSLDFFIVGGSGNSKTILKNLRGWGRREAKTREKMSRGHVKRLAYVAP
jgi:hypothetical protein